MQEYRSFEEQDIPLVINLFNAVMNQKVPLKDEVSEYYKAIFLDNPWRDDRICSQICLDNGQAVGFLGVIPRQMRYKDETILVAASTLFMVRPEWRNKLVGIKIQTAFMKGKQDLCVADGAGSRARKIWEGCGGAVSQLHRFKWFRPLQPFQYANSYLRSPLLRDIARPFCWAADRLTPMGRLVRQMPLSEGYTSEAVDNATIAKYTSQHQFLQAVAPSYDAETLTWQLDLCASTRRRGTLRCVVVRDVKRQVVGGFVYYLKPEDRCTLVQLWGNPQSLHEVIDHLFTDVQKQNGLSIGSRIDTSIIDELEGNGCFFRASTPVLFHSRRPELLAAINSGDIAFSRLDGEWWMDFASFSE